MNAWDIFYANTVKNSLVKNGDRILLSVSGGPDSVCMFHLFRRLSKKTDIELVTASFDHGLRKESAKETLLVSELSEKLGIRCISRKIAAKEYALKHSVSIETAGRSLRYANLEDIARELKCNKIATAHNANDNAETVLMWLLRGSGSLAGIPQRRHAGKNIEIIRPLLPVNRKKIEEYVKKQKLPFCTDKSNFSREYTRNRIRLDIIPHLEKINPMAVEHIFSLSGIQAREDAYFEEISIIFAKKCAVISKNRILLDLTRFLRYNEAIRYRVLKYLFPDKKYASHINAVMDRILSAEKAEYRLSSQWIFRISAGIACKARKAVFERKKS